MPHRRLWGMVVAAIVSTVLGAPPSHAALSLMRLHAPTDGTGSEPAVSAGGRYVVWTVEPGGQSAPTQIWLYDRLKRHYELISVGRDGKSPGDASSFFPSVSSDGRYVVFTSSAQNLVPGGRGQKDIYLRDRKLHRTTRVSLTVAGREPQFPSTSAIISADGSTVALVSNADLTTPAGTQNVAVGGLYTSSLFWLSVRNPRAVRKLADGVIERWTGVGLSLSAHGDVVAFVSAKRLTPDDSNTNATHWDVYAMYVGTKTTYLLNDASTETAAGAFSLCENAYADPRVDATGSWVTFEGGSNCVNGTAVTVYARNLRTGMLRTVADCTAAPGCPVEADLAITGDGARVLYEAQVLSTTAPATNGLFDVPVQGGAATRVSPDPPSVTSSGSPTNFAESSTGAVIAFVTVVAYSADDTTYGQDVYLEVR